MANTPVAVSDFGGLDLTSSPDSSGCIDMLNVDLDKRGALRSRDGFVDFTAVAAAGPYLNAHVRQDGDVLATRASAVDALSNAGAVTATQATASSPAYQYADIGTVSAEYTYFSTPASERLRRWDGAAFASPANNPGSVFVAVQPTDGRLVSARTLTLPTGSTATASVSLVHFSAAGAPDTWGATDWVQLAPGGGGDTITGAIAWRELLFIFKETKFFVFYGNSVDSTGSAVFNYRTVDTGVGATFGSKGQLVAAAPDAVYFVGTDHRIYRTTGGPPVAISAPVEPILRDTQEPFSQASALDTYLDSLTYADGRLIFNYNAVEATVGSGRQLVYDVQGDYWLYWQLPAFSFAANGVNSSQRYPIYFANSTTNDVSRIDREATTDDGTAITSRYRTGFTDLGYPGQEKDIDSTRVWGTGTVAVSGSRDFGDLDTATNVTLGTSPAVAAALHNKQKVGELISYEFGSVSGGAWRLHRYAHYLRDLTPPGERTA